MKKVFIWDLDGTLIDSKQDILFYLNEAIHLANIPTNLKEKNFTIGPPLQEILLYSYPQLSLQQIHSITSIFRKLYDNSNFEKTVLFPDIKDILISFNNSQHLIVTNKPLVPAQRILRKLNIEAFFYTVHSTHQDNNFANNKKNLIKTIITDHHYLSQNVLCIGDSVTDIEAGNENKTITIGVTWGSCSFEQLKNANPCYIAKTTIELKKLLKKLFYP